MSHLLSCQSISKSYGPVPLFDGLSLSLSEGERVGILGPNGSGKSTLLKLLARVENPDSGEIAVRRGLKIAYLPQEDSFDLDQTIEQVLSGSLEHEGIDPLERATRISKVLGLVELEPLNAPIRTLSGGGRKRLAIAAQIIKEPELFLIDEPTNHLDIEGIQWLERFLLRADFSLVLVSHDRTFLENVTNRVLEINHRFPQGYFNAEGNYSRFLDKREEYLTAIQKHEDSLANRVRHEMEWLRRGPKARGTKASARIQEANRLINELRDYQSRSRRQAAAEIEFSGSGRKTKRLMSIDSISKTYAEKPLFQDLSFVLSPGIRIGLLGDNGSGKSTLLKILSGELTPDNGIIERAPELKVVMFDQGRELLNKEASLRRTLAPDSDTVVFQGQALHIASYASRFLFRGDSLNAPIGSLSGGEQARVLIARLMLQPADVLLLDEPTNDLDIDTLEVLEESLEEFPGAVVLVTHDRLMLDRISNILIALDSDHGVSMYAEYPQWLEAKKNFKKETTEKIQKPKKACTTKLSYFEKKDLAQIESRIEEAEALLKRYHEEVADPAIATDAQKLAAAYDKLHEQQKQVDQLYDRWAELSAKLSQ